MAYGVRLKDEATGAIISFLRNSATEERAYDLPDRDLLTADFGLVRTSVAFVETAANGGSDSTGLLGLYNRPFATINAALDALPSTGGIIYIGIGDFDAPTDDILSGAIDPASKLKNNVSFIGTQMPWIDSTYTVNTFPTYPSISAPTKLQNGTVIKGGIHFVGRNRIRMKNLGVDVGSAFCTATGGSYASGGNCLAFVDDSSILGTQPPVAVNYGLIVENVITLGQNATAAFHGLTLGSVLECKVDGLYTFFNTWGVAAKTQGSSFKNIFAHGHTNGGFIFKSDTYGPCQMNTLDGFFIQQIAGVGGGFQFEAATAALFRNRITNGIVYACSYGVSCIATSAMTANIFSDVTALNNTGDGFAVSGNSGSFNSFVNCNATANGGFGFNINSASGNIIRLVDPEMYANSNDGLNVAASSKVLIGGTIFSHQNTGYGIDNAGTVYRYARLYTANTVGGERTTGAGAFVDSNSSTQV